MKQENVGNKGLLCFARLHPHAFGCQDNKL